MVSYENKQAIKLELKDTLQNSSNYSLVISKKANPSLLADIVYPYSTSDELKITKFQFIDYSKSCLYVNNDLDKLTNESLGYWEPGYYSGGEKFVTFTNSGILKSLAK